MALNPGRLVSTHFPYLPIRVRVGDRDLNLDALVDTGFEGYVVLPAAQVGEFESPDGQVRWTLADGSSVHAPYYFGDVSVGEHGPFHALITTLGSTPLVGQGIVRQLTIILDRGRRVIVEP